MGGTGSGRRATFCAKTTVEACHTLEVGDFVRDEFFRTVGSKLGALAWTDTRTGEEVASLGYRVVRDNDRATLTLSYRFVNQGGQAGQSVEERIELVSTPCHFGGLRWWFLCPLVVQGRSCRRRVAKLHLPPGGTWYGCRHCYDLTYQSCQDSHRFDKVFGLVAQDLGEGWTTDLVRRLLQRRKLKP